MIPPNAGLVNNAIKTCVVEYSINSSLLILSLSLHHQRKTDGKVLSPLSAYIFLYLILPIAHKEVRRVVPAVRMLAYRHRHCGIGLCQNISPMPLAKKPYRFFANSHARVAQQQFRAAYSIIPVGTDTATSFNYHKRKTDGKVLSPLSAYIFLYLILPIAHKEVRRVVPAV